MEKRTALENLDLILLCIDEIIDGGYALPKHLAKFLFDLTNLITMVNCKAIDINHDNF